MDLRLIPGAVATDAERSAIEAAIVRPDRDLLLPALHAAQASAGWISPGALNHICGRLDVPPAEAFGVASFYSMFSMEPRPPRLVHVCDDIACRLKGAEQLCAALEGKCAVERSPCLGLCERAPAALFQVAGEGEWTLAPATAEAVLAGVPGDPPPALLYHPMHLLGRADRRSLELTSLAQARRMGPEAVIREVIASKLAGRGGAAFPCGRKWEAVARQPARPHYFVLNADESEPGTFKDRVLMEEDPFGLIEATAIAAFAVGADKAFIYVRGEYPLAARRLTHAIETLDVGIDIELRRGAGAYICGEETALFNSIEGKRGEPRQKPPFPVESGLFGKPTAINNVETLANVPRIVREGAAAFAASETKLFCLSGAVDRPGLYEVPMGTTLRALLGMAGARDVRAVLLGGAAGTFLTPDELDVPLSFEGTRAIGASIGSGVVMVFDGRADLRDTVMRIAAFFRQESCGQCVPCRVGTVRQEEALRDGAVGLLEEIGQVMRDASICGLGQTASSAVLSAVKKLKVLAP